MKENFIPLGDDRLDGALDDEDSGLTSALKLPLYTAGGTRSARLTDGRGDRRDLYVHKTMTMIETVILIYRLVSDTR